MSENPDIGFGSGPGRATIVLLDHASVFLAINLAELARELKLATDASAAASVGLEITPLLKDALDEVERAEDRLHVGSRFATATLPGAVIQQIKDLDGDVRIKRARGRQLGDDSY